MNITRLETFSVSVPLHEGSWHSEEYIPEGYDVGGEWIRAHWPEVPIVIMQLHTDEGLIGLGEMVRGISEQSVHECAPFFVGRDIGSFNLQELPIVVETPWVSSVYSGFEMALYDLMGKAMDQPVYKLFGGKFREWIPVSRCTGQMTPDHAAGTARDAVSRGYRVMKMKATHEDPVVDRLEAIQDAVGDKLMITIDPNERFYQPYHLFELLRQLSARSIHNLECVESPFDQNNLDWYVLARQKSCVPIALHLSNPRAVIEAIKREACDWLNLGGSLTETYKLASVAEAAGIPVWHGSGVGLGISEAAYAHVSAASRSITLNSDICGETLREDDLIQEPLCIAGGHVRVPEGPGLGVDLDMEAVERYRVKNLTPA